MKRLRSLFLLLTLTLMLPGVVYAAVMSNYCSAPPYVTRTIAPNIMVLMDNSLAMYGPAYTDSSATPGTTDTIAYLPNAANNNYIGYFVPDSCYSSGAKFVEVLKNNVACTAAAPFRGNLMNWATMSKYDVLQKVLIGGNTTSKQSNANTVLSIGGTFPDKVYLGCRFKVSNANLTITEDTPGACLLLNNPRGIIAATPRQAIPSIGELIGRLTPPVSPDWTQIAAQRKPTNPTPIVTQKAVAPTPSVMATAITAIGGVLPSAELAALWENLSFASKAWGGTCASPVLASSLTATVGIPYSLILNGENINANNTVHTWTVSAKPAWLDTPLGTTTYTNTSKITRYSIALSGTPTTVGTSVVTVTYVSTGCTVSSTVSFTINVIADTLKIITPTSTTTDLPPGTVGAPYSFDLFGQGGVKPMIWSASGLPTGLSITTENDTVAGQNSYVGHITGTPTSAGTSNVIITLRDSASPSVATSTISLPLIIYPGLTISTNSLPSGSVGENYSVTMDAIGGVTPYTWSISAGTLPAGITLNPATGLLSGTPLIESLGAHPFTISVVDSATPSTTASDSFTITVGWGGIFAISSPQILPTAYKGVAYTYQMLTTGGSFPYTWSILGAPAGMTIDEASGLLSWTPTNNVDSTYTFSIQVADTFGLSANKDFTVTSLKNAPNLRSASFNVKVDIVEETLNDLNGNDIWDLGETYTDSNGNGSWDGKTGLFQKFWDDNIPKARWGMTKFGNTLPDVSCIPASPVASWYTGIQNATPADASPLATGLYGAVNYYGFNSPYDTGFTGCNSDPIDNVPCRKNFILVISSGSDVTGTAFTSTADCSQTAPLVRNACVAFKTDLRTETGATGKQNVYTYVVNTMGANATNNAILNATAVAGGGKYYDASNATTMEAQLTNALQDILSQAASGTAVSVLTTSSRGIGSMVQAYFLPVRTDGTRDVTWTGYTQDLWIDPQDNLREDTVQDLQMKPTEDKVVKLFFDSASNETRVARFSTLLDGSGGTLDTCVAGDIEPFSSTKYLWEAGQKLALRDPDTRTLMTAKNVIHGVTVTNTFATNTFTTANVTSNATLSAALNPATLTATEIVDYVRGVDKETAEPTKFRDRRLTVGSPAALHVWKLGDVISSTPKVLANTPANTYHIDYGDSTYYSYVTGSGYKERSSVAFVGANDGVLHAFRVGYLKDTGLAAGIKGLFKNTFAAADTEKDQVGQEMWGYIPFNSFPYLQYLANPGYCHIYFNDLSVRIVDASVGDSTVNAATFPTAAKDTASWRTILIGGMRFGGACDGGLNPPMPMANVGYSAYYAIDITDPTAPIPLWEFSDPDMGYATSYPSIVRTGLKPANGSWYVAFGSGSQRMPKSNTDMQRTSTGYVYLLDLKSGALVKKVGLDHNAIVSDIVAIDSQKDANVDALYFGTSYFPYPLTTQWGGKQITLDVAGNVPALCGVGVLRSATDCGVAQRVIFNGPFPFTASPDVARDPSGNTWLYAGSGKYFSDVDEGDINNNIMFGIKAKLTNGTSYPTITIGDAGTLATDFIDRTTVETTGTVTSTRQECLYNSAGSGATQFSKQTVVTGIAVTSATPAIPTKGWYVTLPAGERVISRPLAVGGLVDFLTYKPSNDICSYGGNSYLYAVDYQRGVAPTNVAIRAPATTNNTTTMNAAVTINKGILLGPGAPPTGEAITIPPPKEGQEQLKKKIQIATGVIVEAENTPVISTISKVVHWLKK